MYCKYCGKENKDTQKFCKYCGKTIGPKKSEDDAPSKPAQTKAVKPEPVRIEPVIKEPESTDRILQEHQQRFVIPVPDRPVYIDPVRESEPEYGNFREEPEAEYDDLKGESGFEFGDLNEERASEYVRSVEEDRAYIRPDRRPEAMPERKRSLDHERDTDSERRRETNRAGQSRTDQGSDSVRKRSRDRDGESDEKSGGINKILIALIVLLALILILTCVLIFLYVRNPSPDPSENTVSEDVAADIEEVGNPEGEETALEEASAVTEEPAKPEAFVPAEEEAPEAEEAAPEPEEQNTGEKNLDIHNYEVFTEDITWTEAYDRCRQKGGYLARIDSIDEYNVICDLLNSKGVKGIAYIGGRRDPDSEKYVWVGNDGELYDYDVSGDDYRGVWLDGEPSFHDEVNGELIDECYMTMLYRKSENRWYWNDIANDVLSLAPDYYTGSISYVCEYE